MKKILVQSILSMLCLNVFGQTAKDVDINYMLRGNIYAASSIKDSLAPGGFWESGNFPKKISADVNFREQTFQLGIDIYTPIIISKKYNGYNLYIANKSDSTVKLNAADSRLPVIAQVFFNNQWRPIEYLPISTCGNSRHHVYLRKGEYWKFDIPKFSGKIKARLRYRLELPNGNFIYSNEIDAGINKKQLTQKQGYNPKGLMDPYSD